jgi:hypothetical protein
MRIRRLTTTSSLATIGALAAIALCQTPAAAAGPPETPLAGAAQSITATGATLAGELNPGTSSEELEYSFAYNAGTECQGGATIPAPPGKTTGGHQSVSAVLSGLQPSTHYSACLTATNMSGSATSAPVAFTTLGVPPSVEAESVAAVGVAGVTFEARINAENQATTYRFEYALSEAAVLGGGGASAGGSIPAGVGDQPVTTQVEGLQPDTTYYYRVTAESGTPPAAHGAVLSFTTLPPPPTAQTGAATERTETAALLTGTVDPNGLSTTYYYQYGESAEYSKTTPAHQAGAGSVAVQAPAELDDLVPSTVYHYRLVAVNEDGATYGEDRQFTTDPEPSPVVATGATSAITTEAANISGIVDPQGLATTYAFEIGTDTNYGAEIFGTASLGNGNETVEAHLGGLQPNTTYHYRLIATNEAGTTYGVDQTFTTAGILDPLVTPATASLVATPAIAFPAAVKPSVAKKQKKTKTKRKTKRKAGKTKPKAKHKAKGSRRRR